MLYDFDFCLASSRRVGSAVCIDRASKRLPAFLPGETNGNLLSLYMRTETNGKKERKFLELKLTLLVLHCIKDFRVVSPGGNGFGFRVF